MSALLLARQFLQNAITDELTSVRSSATVCLSSSSVPFSDTQTVTGALAGEASYNGYARQTWPLTPIGLAGHDYAVPQGTIAFNPPSSGPAAVATGFFVLYTTPGAATAMMGGASFAGSVTMTVGGPGLIVVLNLADFDAANP